MYDTDASERRRGREGGRKREEEEERWRRRAGQGATKPPLPRNQTKRCPLGLGPILLLLTRATGTSGRHVEVNVMHAHTSCSNRGYQSRPRTKDYFSHLIKQRVSRFDDKDGDNRILPCSDCCCCRAFRRSCHSRVPCELPDHDACLPS